MSLISMEGRKGLAIVVMGVSGAGKSTVGALLAERLECRFFDADDYHSVANKEKMKSGVPLTDEDRAPWLRSLATLLADNIAQGKTVVLACSALRDSYRDILRGAALPATREGKDELIGDRSTCVAEGRGSEDKGKWRGVDEMFSEEELHVFGEHATIHTEQKSRGGQFSLDVQPDEGKSGIKSVVRSVKQDQAIAGQVRPLEEETDRGSDDAQSEMGERNRGPEGEERGSRKLQLRQGGLLLFVHLDGPRALFEERRAKQMKAGQHFMPASLVQSQLDTLKFSKEEKGILVVDASLELPMLVAKIVEYLESCNVRLGNATSKYFSS
eukprot:TRINITY_DN5867_c0_g1_i1.p1 TRINITY_DN5867_c0_g1~~TRINITY_DN5867_c0_g1_i1.p1  ORF type:complete len:327 (-),score=44.38 TRINITY_DN5867_c0_g1_i1:33-1013(-)